jgi:hypothetical protein
VKSAHPFIALQEKLFSPIFLFSFFVGGVLGGLDWVTLNQSSSAQMEL